MDKINAIIEKRKLTLERTPAEESKKANLTDNTTLPATISTASKEGAPSTHPAAINAKSVAKNPQVQST